MTAVAVAAPVVYTARDLERLSDQGYHYELVKGKLRPMSPCGGPHGSATSRISFYVSGLVYGYNLGETFAAETGFFVEQDLDTVLAPDFAFVAHKRLPDPLPEGFVQAIPDFAVETRSPNDTRREVAEKVDEWLTAGVRLVWVIEPKKRTITTHCLGRDARTFTAGETVDGEDVLPGLAVPLDHIFPPRRNPGQN